MNRLRYLLFSLVLLSLPSLLLSQTATLSGTVTDEESGETLIGATVRLASDDQVGTATDVDGKFSMNIPANQDLEIVVSYVGYEGQSKSIRATSGQNLTVSFLLEAESTIMGQLVVTGSKFERSIGEETVSMEVIKPSQIANVNATSVEQAIARVPGVNVLDGQVNIRGGSGYSYGAGTRVLLLYNDMPILQADAGFPNWTAVPIENIGQVELIKGASSALYGSSAINGIINLRPAEPTSKPYFMVSAFGTVYGTPRDPVDSLGRKNWWVDSADYQAPHQTGLNLAYRKKFGRVDVSAGGYFYKEESFRWGEFDNRGRVNLLTRWRPKGIDGLTLGLNVNSQVGESGSFFLWNGNGSQAYTSWSAIGRPTMTDAFRLTIDPYLNYFDGKGNHHRLQLRYNQVDNDNTMNQGNFSKFYYGEYQYQKRLESIDLTLTGGAVANYVTVTADLYADSVRLEDNSYQIVGDPLDGSNYSLYAQVDKKFFGTLNLSAGARLESNKISFTPREEKVVFRAGLNYQAAEYTYLRASWGQGYRFPTIAEKFIETLSGLLTIAPNPDLVSETGYNAELGLRQGIKIGGFKGYTDIAAYYQEYSDMMEFTYTLQVGIPFIGGFQSQNIGDTRIYGIDASIAGEGKLGDKNKYQLMLGYTWSKPEFQDFTQEVNDRTTCDENILTYRYEHTVKGEADVFFGDFSLGTSIQYYSFMKCIDRVFNGEIIPGVIPGVAEFRAENDAGDFIIDLRTSYKLAERYKFTFLVRNVTNREYSLRPARIDAPVNFTLRFDYVLGK
jgi:iron complex outermembrane receptor protein